MGKASAWQAGLKIALTPRRFLYCGCSFGYSARSVPINPVSGMTGVAVGHGALQDGGSIVGSAARVGWGEGRTPTALA